MNYFTQDNTEGFTSNDLDMMNQAVVTLLNGSTDEDDIKNACDRVNNSVNTISSLTGLTKSVMFGNRPEVVQSVASATIGFEFDLDLVNDFIDTRAIRTMKWNDDLVGYVVELYDGRTVQVQFYRESNISHGGYGLFYPEIDTTNDYGLDLSVDESELFNRFLRTNDEIMDKSRELDEQVEEAAE